MSTPPLLFRLIWRRITYETRPIWFWLLPSSINFFHFVLEFSKSDFFQSEKKTFFLEEGDSAKIDLSLCIYPSKNVCNKYSDQWTFSPIRKRAYGENSLYRRGVFTLSTPKVQVSDSTSNGQISPTSAKNDSQPVVLHAQVLSMSVLMCLMIALMIAARLVTWRADMCLK